MKYSSLIVIRLVLLTHSCNPEIDFGSYGKFCKHSREMLSPINFVSLHVKVDDATTLIAI